ncbi:Mutanase [Trichoderma ghanense]|uniref:Mutanase n=1 Tax=Trichoderma ghanense TaxID=65468 RepID=A0ABY2H6K4_9HYPO
MSARLANSLAALVVILCNAVGFVVAQGSRPVFAHFMVGIVEKFTIQDWIDEIQQAQAVGIDGFALNCAPPWVDSYTPKQLDNAYTAAQQLNFKMFISFDFAYWSNGDTGNITSLVGKYAAHPAQAMFNGGALVSTFVGDSFNWNAVKSALGSQKLTVIPNMQDPASLGSVSSQLGIDGAFSWYAWPTDGGNSVIKGPMTTVWDLRYIQGLGGRPYMAPVSPWFSTHFNTKNWVFICEEQPVRRWQQILDMKPALVEIITWNDFGESHYISGSEPNHSDDGSSQWANGFPHDGWRDIYKPYIAAYKAGASSPTVQADELVYWYRPTPHGAQCSSDPLGIPRGAELMDDLVFVSTLLTQPAQLTVTSGNVAPVTVNADAGIHVFNFTMGVGKQSFSLSRGGRQILGGQSAKDISSSCQTYNFNAYVGKF